MVANLAILRSQVESALTGRVVAPFTYRDRKVMDTVSAGIPEIDLLAGGLPRGGLTEICGPPCSGRTSLLISALAERTANEEACALVDGHDAFDPHSAQAAGVELEQLLWVRCHNIDQALRATDLLIQGGGFGLIALDLSDIPPQTVRYVPLNAWFRFRRAVEDTSTILVVLEQEPNAKTCASLVLQLGSEPALWSSTQEISAAESRPTNAFPHSSACLLESFSVRAELLRSHMQASGSHSHLEKTGTSGEIFFIHHLLWKPLRKIPRTSLPHNSKLKLSGVIAAGLAAALNHTHPTINDQRRKLFIQAADAFKFLWHSLPSTFQIS
jgi:recombination protein RecA